MANDYNILIDKYLNGTATPEEVAAVEQLVETDADFADLLKNEQLVNEFIHLGSLVELKVKMKNMDLGKPKASYSKWSIAASVLVMIVFTYLVLSPGNNDNVIESPVAEKSIANDSSDKVLKPTPDSVLTHVASSKNSSRVEDTSYLKQPAKAIQEEEIAEDSVVVETENNNSMIAPQSYFTEENTQVLKTDTVTDPTINPCEVSFIEPEFEITPSCIDKNTGEIMVKAIDGVFPPYKYQLVDYNNNVFTVNRIFSGLKANNYNFTIIDNEGCTKSFSLVVGEKECREEEKIISSLSGAPCVFDLTEANGVISFYNAKGVMIKQIPFSNTNSVEWHGKDSNGLPLPTGEYFYQIKYSSGNTEAGNITIAN